MPVGFREDLRLLKNPEVKGKQTTFQMFADPEHSDWNTVVHADTSAVPSGLAGSDYVRVRGTVMGAFSGQNAFGANVKATEVQADSVETAESSTGARSKKKY